MSDSDNSPFQPVNDPIQPHSQVNACIEILGFGEMVEKGEIPTIQVFYEKIGQEIYNTRKKNYIQLALPGQMEKRQQRILLTQCFRQ